MKKSEVKVGMKVVYQGRVHVVTRLRCRPGNVAIISPEYATAEKVAEWIEIERTKSNDFAPGMAVPATSLTLA